MRSASTSSGSPSTISTASAVYADPIGLAGVLAASLKHAGIGFAVIQTALHHPIRLAEQIALLDQLLKGKLIVGLGRGSSFNIYDYQGFGLDHREAQARLEEAEAIMLKAWTGGEFTHEGRFWQLQVPMLRPARTRGRTRSSSAAPRPMHRWSSWRARASR